MIIGCGVCPLDKLRQACYNGLSSRFLFLCHMCSDRCHVAAALAPTSVRFSRVVFIAVNSLLHDNVDSKPVGGEEALLPAV